MRGRLPDRDPASDASRAGGTAVPRRTPDALRVAILAAAGILPVALAACAGISQPVVGEGFAGPRCHEPARSMVRLELVFGMARPMGLPVSDAEWRDFLEGEVTPRFPAGLTVLSALGQWQGSDGRVTREPSRILIIFHEPDGGAEAEIEAIRAAYKRRFDQESVMRVESMSCVSF